MLKDDDFRWERTVAWEILLSLIRVYIFESLSTALPAVRIAFDSGSFFGKTFWNNQETLQQSHHYIL